MANSSQTFKGTRDITGDEMRFKQSVIEKIRRVFVSFGFEELETPIIEREETLLGKYGTEGEKLIFRLREIHKGGLRYDHTVPLARFMAANTNKVLLPYRRFSIGPVFRAESPQSGRFRQFTQCDFDTVGSKSVVVDAEIVSMNHQVLSALGFTDQYKVTINDRRLLNALVAEMGYSDQAQIMAVFRAWDKLDKVQPAQALEYLVTEFMEIAQVDSASARTQIATQLSNTYNPVTNKLLQLQGQPTSIVLSKLTNAFTLAVTQEAIQGLVKLVQLVNAMEVPEQRYELNPLLARGLDYYTGPIFETVIKTSGIGSVTGGGRYDNLIESMGGPSQPASGSSFGLERVLTVMEQLGLRPQNVQTTQVFVTVFDTTNAEIISQGFHLANALRDNGIATEVYMDSKKLRTQLALANSKNIPLALIMGPDELLNKTVNVKDLRSSGNQITIPVSQLVNTVKQLL